VYFNNLSDDTEYIIRICSTGDHLNYKNSEYIQEVIRTKVKEIIEPEYPDEAYLYIIPEYKYLTSKPSIFQYSLKTNRNWKMEYEDSPYLSILPRGKKNINSGYNLVNYKVKTNLYWTLNTGDIFYLNVKPESKQTVKHEKNIEYQVNTNTYWSLQYVPTDLWDNIEAIDSNNILLDKNGKEILVKIT
jgi:hypothetical protein